jgi:hypothetical protein
MIMSSVCRPQLHSSLDGAASESQAIADLQRSVAELKARIAKLEQPQAQWMPLKTAAHDCSIEYERARTWAVVGFIEARREGGRWFVNVVSLRARVRLLGSASGAGSE